MRFGLPLSTSATCPDSFYLLVSPASAPQFISQSQSGTHVGGLLQFLRVIVSRVTSRPLTAVVLTVFTSPVPGTNRRSMTNLYGG